MGPTIQWGLAICRGGRTGVVVTNCLLLVGGGGRGGVGEKGVDFEIKTGLGKGGRSPRLPPADK